MEGESSDAARPYSVSSLTAGLKGAIEARFAKIYLEAEISGWRVYPSGHAYFTLKDPGAQISGVMFASALARCRAKAFLKDGAKMLFYGSVSVYAPRGNYQFVALAARLVGEEGDLMQRYRELKEKLEKEGLFDVARKRALPFMPRRIGIVTSEAGAVIHDMCTVLARRFPALEIRLYPSLVQGDGAAETIVAGIAWFNSRLDLADGWKADVLIVARGGGSFEDLFCFNDENLVRAVAASRIPTVSAVGHETDFTLCDFAADFRAGTPSIAAERVVPVKAELDERVASLASRLSLALRARGEFFAQRIDQLSDALGAALAISHMRAARRFEALIPRLETCLKNRLQHEEARFENLCTKLTAYSPYGVLERGYSLTTAADGSIVKDASRVKPGDRLTTRLAKGVLTSTAV